MEFNSKPLFYNSKLSSPLCGFDPISPLFYTIFRIVVSFNAYRYFNLRLTGRVFLNDKYPISPLIAIPDRFQIPKMTILGLTLDPTRHVVNYNIHMDLRIAYEWLICIAFPTTLDEQEKMWFASLAPNSITSFRQLTDLFEAGSATSGRDLSPPPSSSASAGVQTSHYWTTWPDSIRRFERSHASS
ncbi:hypothetical protein ACLOJK_037255 [Asimina triloba]